VTGNASVEGTSRFETQKPGKRPCGDAPAPEPSADPVAYFPLTGVHEAYDVASHLALEEHRLFDDGPVLQNPVPVRHERFSVPGGETGHVGRLRVELVFEEEGEVRLFHVPQGSLGVQTCVPFPFRPAD